ncbi:DUF72 domain-containing protein [Phenylobacterium sp.]|uniref:DUF72 domain-containing protein n=1 Tax=Phenylobacterium sp. TaxID=1871053 RepID=UPI0027302D90|nr:DUF72 domain-containing protein [Phenylobacterium sp.]MDP1617188.1 DUF72 domain-containing protein [Phenylobacterium sp.]MDP1988608.1 DUF72 domain-containing protein [Phenylobacterium sp.]
MTGQVRAGIGGWTFEPWRGIFYPQGLRQADELAYASAHLPVIEINSTYYSSQKPESFAKWAAATPEGFVFTLKASRFCTNRKVLKEAGESVDKFLNQGIAELGDRLGPILWQFMATKRFDAEDFEGFLDLLPSKLAGLPLRHAVEVRHESFADPAFLALCRARNVAVCLTEHAEFPMIADPVADFVYARLMAGSDDIETGYEPKALDQWADRLQVYAAGDAPDDLPMLEAAPKTKAREVFAFFISEGKVRAPAAAQALMTRLKA